METFDAFTICVPGIGVIKTQTIKSKRGRHFANWHDEYRSKLCSVEDAAARIQSDDRIAMSGGTSCPPGFSIALGKRAGEVKNVLLSMGYTMGLYDLMKPEHSGSFHIESVYVGPVERVCMNWGTAQYVPIHLGDIPQYCRSKNFNRAATVVTEPDENGYMNRSCFAAFLDDKTISDAETVIVEVNRHSPWINSDDFKIHVSEVDCIIENHQPLFEIPEVEISDAERLIAENLVDLVPDGSTIHLGFGGMGKEVTDLLQNRKDIGIHSEIITPSIRNLVDSGVANGARKSFMPGVVVGSFCAGTSEFYDYIHRNENYYFAEIGWVNDPLTIAQNDNLVSINNALLMDLTGQVASESIGFRQYSGMGSQMNYLLASRFARNGRSVMTLTSTYRDREGTLKSKIMVDFPPCTMVNAGRNDIHYVVTEWGVADLKFKSVRDRVKQMIAIAHPEFRDELAFQAKKAGWL